MCGISGIINFSKEDPDMRGRIRRMTDAMRHRGPDDEGFLAFDPGHAKAYDLTGPGSRVAGRRIEDFNERAGIFLGHRRLSIIDLSPKGHQPMCNRDGTLWIVHNGEVYNYREVRRELQAMGEVFGSNTDTEVVLKAYQRWGEGCLSRFNGMFAFAILDIGKMRLFCARDRFGIKPFYYTRDKNGFAFASEIKAFFAAGLIANKANDAVCYRYLLYGMSDYDDQTFVDGLKRLPSGHYLSVCIRTGKLDLKKYYGITCREKKLLPDEEYGKRFYDLFEDSVKLRMMSDVPVGSCLSGGLDSSSIVCVMNDLARQKKVDTRRIGALKAFTAHCRDKRFDETRFIDSVIAKAGFTALKTYPKAADLRREMEELIFSQDEPFVSLSVYAQWKVFRLSGEAGVKVMLDGQGADELLGGYDTHMYEFFAQLLTTFKWRSFVKELLLCNKRRGLSPASTLKYTALHLLPVSLRGIMARSVVSADNPFYWPKRCLTSDIQDDTAGLDLPDNTGRLDKALYRTFYKGLPEFLRYEDRNSMAHSIESRLPFLDHRLVEFVFSAPEAQKIRDGKGKVILRRAMKGVLPEIVRNRYDKIGFASSQEVWFRNELRDHISDIIRSESFKSRAYFRHNDLEIALEEYFNGRIEISPFIWRVVNLELWMRNFIDKNTYRTEEAPAKNKGFERCLR